MKEEKEIKLWSFKRGYDLLPRKELPKVKEEIKKVLLLKSDNAFYRRLNGEVSPSMDDVMKILEIFSSRGINKPFYFNITITEYENTNN